MVGDQPELSLAVVEDLKGKGYSQSDIAQKYGVTRQYVSWIKHYYGGRLTPREEYMQHFPFQVPVAMQQGVSPYRNLRYHGEYMATQGLGMDDTKLSRLRGFYKKLRDHVLEFDPNIPPEPGVSKHGGWAYRERTPEERESGILIRVNDYTELTDKGAMIWRFPPREP